MCDGLILGIFVGFFVVWVVWFIWQKWKEHAYSQEKYIEKLARNQARQLDSPLQEQLTALEKSLKGYWTYEPANKNLPRIPGALERITTLEERVGRLEPQPRTVEPGDM